MLIGVTLLLAKHPKRRRRMGRYIRGNVDETLALTTLANRTLVAAVFDEVVTERSLISSLVASWAMDDFTAGIDIGPIMVGIAHSDYSAAEIEEYIENTASWAEADQIGQEVGKRKVRIAGIFGRGGVSGSADHQVLNNGDPIKMKLNWILNAGQTLDLWAFNLGTAAVATTVPDVHVQGHVNLWPR